MPNRSGQGNVGLIAVVFFGSMLMVLMFLGIPLATSLAIIAGCAIFLLAIFNTDLALIILIFSMLLSPEFTQGSAAGRSVKVRADDIFIMIIFCGWLAKMAINKEMGLIRQTRLNTPVILYVVICLFASFLGIVAGRTNVKSAFFFLIKYIEYFLLFFMVANNLKTVKQAKKFVFFLILTCLFVCIYSTGQVAAGGRPSAPFESGAGGEPNTFAGYLILMMSLMAAFIIYPPSFKQRVALIGLLCVAAVSFLMTLSRSGWISAFPAVGTFILATKKYRFQLVILVVVVAMALPIIAPKQVQLRVQETFTPWKEYNVGAKRIGVDESTAHRIDSWKVGINRWMYKPIFGYGIPAGAVIDNQYTRVLNESGIIGFSVFIWMLITLFQVIRECYVNAGDNYFNKAMGLGLMAGFMGILLLNFAASAFILIRIMEPFWFLVAIVVTMPELEGESSPAPSTQIETPGAV
jgi:O-antigen ligase